MATVQTRERSHSTRKPFGWIQRLYRKSSPHDFGDGENQAHALTPAATTEGAPFLGIGAQMDDSGGGNDMSSLRPTISTRAPSIAQSTVSNAAVRNVEAISSPVDSFDTDDSAHRLTTIQPADTLLAAPQTPAVRASNGVPTTRLTATHTDRQAVATVVSPALNEEASSGPTYSTSIHSSNRSSFPSIFTSKTVDTQPTIPHFTHPASIMSARNGGGLGANDNASMLTLASSSKGPHRRRLSTDTNCSVFAIAPASGRASFESSRTGQTDLRRASGPNNTNMLLFTDDGGTSTSPRPLGRVGDGPNSSRRSVSGFSTRSDTLTVGSSMT